MTGCDTCDFYIERRAHWLLRDHLQLAHRLDPHQAGALVTAAARGYWVRYRMAADRVIEGWETAFTPP